MTNFKSAYDALVAQYEAVQGVAERIEAHFATGEVDAALAIEPELNAAQAKADQIGALYQKLTAVPDERPEQFFVPASDPEDADKEQKPLTRAEFDGLAPRAKADYIAAGGQIVDQE